MENDPQSLSLSELQESIKQLRLQISVYLPISRLLAQEIEQWFKVESIYQELAVDGGTFSREEVRRVLETEVAIGGKAIKDHVYILQHARTLDWIRRSAQLHRSELNEQIVFSLHQQATLLAGESDKQNVPRSSYQVPYVLSEFSDWLQQTQVQELPVIAEAHFRLVSAQPFPDKTDQTAWLLDQLLLMQAGYPVIYLEPTEEELYQQAVASHSSDQLNHLLHWLVVRSLRQYLLKLRPDEQRTVRPGMGEVLKIGQLAELAGESVPTIRYWTQRGLLAVAGETDAGYQLFDRQMIERVKEIRRLQQEERMSLQEIGDHLP